MKKICLVSSSGGHFEQLLMLMPLSDQNYVFIVTEKTKYNSKDKRINHFLPQINRKECLVFLKLLYVFIKSLIIIIKEKPQVVISTGALVSIPMLITAHLFGKKTIFIESFAKISNPSKTGLFIYKHHIADQFYIQWESLRPFYPNAIYKGGIY